MEDIIKEITQVKRDIESVSLKIDKIVAKADEVEEILKNWKRERNWNDVTAATLQSNPYYQDLIDEKKQLIDEKKQLMDEKKVLNEILLEREKKTNQGKFL